MRAAAGAFVGTHDFASLTRAKHGRESTVRTVFSCAVTQTESDRLRVDVSGSGFLYNMVRILVGTLVDVGRGKIAADAIGAVLGACERQHAGSTMPPEGLCLMWIQYGEAGCGSKARAGHECDTDTEAGAAAAVQTAADAGERRS